jgi:hypothetical protein
MMPFLLEDTYVAPFLSKLSTGFGHKTAHNSIFLVGGRAKNWDAVNL